MIEVVEECISASVGVILFPVAEAREEWEEVMVPVREDSQVGEGEENLRQELRILLQP